MRPPVVLAEQPPRDASISLRPYVYGHREVELIVSQMGTIMREQSAATEMLIWGDLDPNCHLRVEATEGAADWIPFAPTTNLVLSAGAGIKTVHVKLRGPLGESEAMEATAEVGSEPHTSLLWSAYKMGGPTQLGWSPSTACTAYRFAMCSNEYDDAEENAPFQSGGALAAGEYVEVTVPEHDASHIVVKMFIEVDGRWYG